MKWKTFSSLYHYDPSNPPATIRYSNTRKKSERQKTLNNNGKPNTSKESTTNNNFTKNKINGEAEKSAAILIDNKYSKTNPSTNNNAVEIEDDTIDDEDKDEYDDMSQKDNNESFIEDESCKTKEEICENEC